MSETSLYTSVRPQTRFIDLVFFLSKGSICRLLIVKRSVFPLHCLAGVALIPDRSGSNDGGLKIHLRSRL